MEQVTRNANDSTSYIHVATMKLHNKLTNSDQTNNLDESNRKQASLQLDNLCNLCKAKVSPHATGTHTNTSQMQN